MLVDYAKVSTEWARSHSREEIVDRNWRFGSSPFVLDAKAAIDAVPANAAYLLGWREPPPVSATSTAGDRDFAQQFSFSLDFWWLYLVYLHAIRPAIAITLALVLLAAALAASHSVWAAG